MSTFLPAMWAAFFILVSPASRNAKPACMNMTSTAATRSRMTTASTLITSSPALPCNRLLQGSCDGLAAPLQEHGVPPDAVPLRDSVARPDDAEAAARVQGETGPVLGEDRRLDRPDPAPLRLLDQRRQERAADPEATRRAGDVDAVLGDAAVAGPS